MNNVEVDWVVRKLVKLGTENQALKKRLGDANAYPVEASVAQKWRDDDARSAQGIPPTVDAILSRIQYGPEPYTPPVIY